MKLKIGQGVIAQRDVAWPGEGVVARQGEVGLIVGIGHDAQFGLAVVKFKDGRQWPLFVSPVAYDGPVRLAPADGFEPPT